jgi:hypothetical protein
LSTIHPLQREELKVVFFVEPAALEYLQWERCPSCESECWVADFAPLGYGFFVRVQVTNFAIRFWKKLALAEEC